MLIIYQGKTEISAKTDTESRDSRQYWGVRSFACARTCTHTHSTGELYANCPSAGGKEINGNALKNKSVQKCNHLANTVRVNFALFALCVCVCMCTHVYARACVKVWRRTGRLRFTLVFKLDGRSRVRTQREAKRKQSADYKRGLSRGAFNKDTESKYKYSSRHAPLKTGSAASRQPRSLCQRRGVGRWYCGNRVGSCLTCTKFRKRQKVLYDAEFH